MDGRHLGVTERCFYLKMVLLVKDHSGQQLVPGSGGEEDHRRAPDSDEARAHMHADSSLESCSNQSKDEERRVCDRAEVQSNSSRKPAAYNTDTFL